MAARSEDEVVDRLSFLRFFHLPGLLGERLFEKFDIKNNGHIDFEEFLNGLAFACRGTEKELGEYLFSLYDLGKDGVIRKEELVTILHNLLPTQFLQGTDRGHAVAIAQLTEPKMEEDGGSKKPQGEFLDPVALEKHESLKELTVE